MASRIVRISDIATTPAKPGILPVSPATIWRWVRDGKFPKPFKMGAATVWSADCIEEFINQCAKGAA